MPFDPIETVAKYKAEFTEPIQYVPQGDTPKQVNPSVSVDAPILGNGDMTCAYVPNAPYPQFWLSTNDFWEMKSQGWAMLPFARTESGWSQGVNGPRTLGRMLFLSRELEGCECRTEQDLLSATTVSVYSKDGKDVLRLTAFISANENLLLVSFEAIAAVGLDSFFLFPEKLGYGSDYEAALVHEHPVQHVRESDGILHGERRYCKNVDAESRLAFAARFLEKDGFKVKLAAGETVHFVMALRSGEKISRPEEYAVSRVRNFDSDEYARQRALHLSWWRNYFSVSGISIADKQLEQRYYLSQYVMGSLSRDLHFPPNLFGVSVSDNPRWLGNYKINYNHQAPYYALYASDHLEQADPHDSPYIDLLDQARDMSRLMNGHKGAVLPLGIGPKGMTSETFTMRMRGCNAMGACNMAMRWYVSYDLAYAQRIYPYICAVADYWCNDMVLEDGVYNIYDECAHETVEQENYFAKNATCTLAYIRVTLKLALSLAEALGITDPQTDKWLDVLQRLAPFPTLPAEEITGLFRIEGRGIKDFVPQRYLEGKTVFLSEEEGKQWAFRFNSSMLQVYPAGEIGLGSDTETLKTVRDTFRLKVDIEDNCRKWMEADPENGFNTTPYLIGRGAFGDPNMTSLVFPAAVRIGYDPEEIWSRLKAHVAAGRANGFWQKNPHGPENCSTVPNVMHEMMLLSHEGILRFFKCWPRKLQPDAAFCGLLAYGAFKVSAELRQGEVCNVRIVSRAGRRCRIENPWPGKGLRIHSAYRNEIMSGEEIAFETLPGESIAIERI